ncbi:bile acid:sodium symporter family protein [Carboxylicivirga sp. N1Y90]|uniref:bile acid:sodium symporter family protein n=1 Tax=Carboxylicivirga fragile TaxID=3417571 RepID=UPI003D330CE9|nr:bile acid:sodium symporter [Marinilabiliaceae bacterium N1Y90]
MTFIVNLIKNRNFVLILAVVLGLSIGDFANNIKDYTIYILALVMTFSMTNIRTKSLYPPSKLYKPMMMGALLNYLIYAVVSILLANWLIDDKELFYGFVVIATTTPGVAIIPFSNILKGDVEYAIKGVLGAFLCAIFLTPFAVGWLTGNDGISSMSLFVLMLKTIVVPLILSRFLLLPKWLPKVELIRGKIVDWGFATLIFIAIGVNRSVFFDETSILFNIALVLFCTHFVMGFTYEYLAKRWIKNPAFLVSQNLLLTIKSSGFAVVTALTLFGKKAAIPTAVLPIFVLLYLLSLSFRQDYKRKKNK